MVFASLLLALFGLAVIFVSAKGMNAQEIQISDVASFSGKYVEVSGYVSKTRVNNNNVFVTLCKDSCITVVVFRSIAAEMSQPNPYLIEKGERLVVRGRAEVYRGEPEVVVLRAGDVERG